MAFAGNFHNWHGMWIVMPTIWCMLIMWSPVANIYHFLKHAMMAGILDTCMMVPSHTKDTMVHLHFLLL